MYTYQNGDLCPCCGQKLKNMTERELQLFSLLMYSNQIEPIEGLQLTPVNFPLPSDAGIYPPKPRREKI